MKYDNYIKVEFPSKSCNEALARSVVGVFASQMDPTLGELGDVKTAVSEAVTNCVIHAYPDSVGVIRLRCRVLEGDLLEILVRDWGCGIPDVEKARTPLFTTGGEERSGMGFTIMESFMDTLKVRSRPGRGTSVVMTRRLSGKTAEG
ncbi:MAG: anti-sigma F factor [Oscillospiraceae bacterium]|nr:anti-sigma F factor [Oscillospiraceae bacterium]